MSRDIKERIELLYNYCDRFEKLFPSNQEPIRDVLKKNIMEFSLYLAASDGIVKQEEADFLRDKIGEEKTPNEWKKYLEEKEIYSERFRNEIPKSLKIFLLVDNNLYKKNNNSPSLCTMLISLLEEIGQALICADGEIDALELRDLNRYLNTLKQYVMSKTERAGLQYDLVADNDDVSDAYKRKRIANEIEEAENTVNKVDVASNGDSSIKKAWAYILENPYRTIGVSVASTSEEVNAALDKIKKLARLNAVSSYKSEFQLNGTEAPERNVSIVQNAITILKDDKYKWFWFAESGACKAWQDEYYRKELISDGPEQGSYDLFLANYLYALFFDPTINKKNLWEPVFSYFSYLCNEPDHSMLKSRFNEKELEGVRGLNLVRSFKAEIFKPLEALCDTDDINRIVRLYKILKDVPDSGIEELTKKIISLLTVWFTSRESAVCKAVAHFDEDDVITRFEAEEIMRIGEGYIDEVDRILDSVLLSIRDVPLRHDMIKESYRNATWQLMFGLHKAKERDKAVFYANKCYPHCKEEDKKKIRGVFGITAIKGADEDSSSAEWDIMGDNYYEGKNGYDRNFREAFRWYKRAAEAGNKYSMNSLGICYREGRGTIENEYEAARWFEKAYRVGNPDGAVNLANCYITGKGKIQDKHRGIDLLVEAAKMGHPKAAELAQNYIELMMIEQKMHRLTQHDHYDLGFQIPIGETIVVEVTLNYAANVYLMEEDDYDKYRECENFSYYGGRATQSPYRIKIPDTGHWHLVIDNGDEDMTGITSSVRTRTFNF